MIGSIRKMRLKVRGYRIEDMEKIWGSGFPGQYRWVNRYIEDRCDGFGEIQYSEEEAWADADQFDIRFDRK